ncbi:Pr6Pr family membrane protein [Antiquaquibacter soli]|uniref:Pr6Pr family membrane protein n=1 Tax=Antiquaquibacter soli TaxID=3064523 RepID=A0ABT9BPT1_9MICO|nr:Pr6Pr family membrane protein [Protaetiibacter sp. WY-16]MDO7881801.1 Pr6Pr family membrane protein [Protaetiibacter sp. WY-16]
MRIAFGIGRLAAAGAGIAAIVGQLLTSLGYWSSHNVQNIPLAITNFFSFFTILSNVGAVVVFLFGAFLLFTRSGSDPRWFTLFRASVATYMIVTGIVYNLLLRGIELPQGSTLEWSNEILHVVVPILALLDWLFTPGRQPIEWNQLWRMLVFPIVWAVYTMIRGPFTPNELTGASYWYPYPFLNPYISHNGYFSVAFYIVLIAAVIGLVAAGVIWLSRRGWFTQR